MAIFDNNNILRAKQIFYDRAVRNKDKKEEKKEEPLYVSSEEVESPDKQDSKEETSNFDLWRQMFEGYQETPAAQEVGDINQDLKTLLDMFASAGIKVRMTSGYREGATTKQGKPSYHASGEAMDIVPEDGNFDMLAKMIKSNLAISSYMKAKGYGIIDESTQEMLNKTGGTGAHFHIGKDALAQQFWM